ncbi:MAG: TIM barrel protein [Cyclobacteriaceae bacterium]
MELGISSFTYGWAIGVPGSSPAAPMSEVDLVQLTLEFGLHTLQIGDNLPLHDFTTIRLNALGKLIGEKNIRLEIGARGLTPERLKVYIEFAECLNSPLIRFVTDEEAYKPSPDLITGIIKGSLPGLTKKNIRLGIENHDRLNALELATIIQNINSPHVGICLDCVNSLGAGEGFEHVLKTLAPFTINLHIKDFKIERLQHRMGFTVTGAQTGKGMINFPLLFETLFRYRRCESAVLEQWVEPEETLPLTIQKEKKWADEGIRYLKAIPQLY